MDSIRAMTWNVWWRFGGNWRRREGGMLRLLRDADPDVLGLQECWSDAAHSQADVIAGVLGERYSAFVEVGLPPIPDPPEDESQRNAAMGVGLVSRWPIRAVQAVDLPSRGRRNAALLATIDHPRGELRVVVAGTSWEPDRVDETAAQFAKLQRLMDDGHAERPNPSILLADLNYDTGQPALSGMYLKDAWQSANPGDDPRTLSSTNRFAPPEAADQYDRRIDHILYLPGSEGAVATAASILRGEPDGMPPSDHYPVLAEIAVGVGPKASVRGRERAGTGI